MATTHEAIPIDDPGTVHAGAREPLPIRALRIPGEYFLVQLLVDPAALRGIEFRTSGACAAAWRQDLIKLGHWRACSGFGFVRPYGYASLPMLSQMARDRLAGIATPMAREWMQPPLAGHWRALQWLSSGVCSAITCPRTEVTLGHRRARDRLA